MQFFSKLWNKIKTFFKKLFGKTEYVAPPARNPVAVPVTVDADWFARQPLEVKLELARSGAVEKGLATFFARQWDTEVSEEERIQIAKAYAFRYGVPYVKPVINQAPTSNGMSEDGSQKRAK